MIVGASKRDPGAVSAAGRFRRRGERVHRSGNGHSRQVTCDELNARRRRSRRYRRCKPGVNVADFDILVPGTGVVTKGLISMTALHP